MDIQIGLNQGHNTKLGYFKNVYTMMHGQKNIKLYIVV